MPSLNTDRIRDTFFYAPNGDPGFTFTVIARASGLHIGVRAEDVPGDAPGIFGFVGPRDQGWASGVEHFGRYLAKLASMTASAGSARTGSERQEATDRHGGDGRRPAHNRAGPSSCCKLSRLLQAEPRRSAPDGEPGARTLTASATGRFMRRPCGPAEPPVPQACTYPELSKFCRPASVAASIAYCTLLQSLAGP